jgi:hypothetical protein
MCKIPETTLIAVVYLMVIAVGASLQARASSDASTRPVVEINSLAQLKVNAQRSGQHVRMEPGVYRINDASFGKRFTRTQTTSSGERTRSFHTLVEFSGNNNTFDFRGVTIEIDTHAHLVDDDVFRLDELLVSGNNNRLVGLTVKDVGDTPTNSSSARMLHVIGNANTIEEVSLDMHGSTPYGYGNRLGKGGHAFVDLHKHSAFLITGVGTRVIGCHIRARAFGHGYVMQGAVNTHFEDCTVKGELRTTDEILGETTGPAADADFKSRYPPGKITSGRMLCLAEDGFRAYPTGTLVGNRRTKNIKLVNCTAINMRGAFDLSFAGGAVELIDCESKGATQAGYALPSNAKVKDSKGDIRYSPLLTFHRKNAHGCRIDLEVIAETTRYTPDRIVEINGSNHQITLTQHGELSAGKRPAIVFGESWYADVNLWRHPDRAPSRYLGAEQVTLLNETRFPVIFTKRIDSCLVRSKSSQTQDAQPR